MEKKFSPYFKDWRIRTKLLVVMLVLSWLPLLVIMGINIQNQIETSQTEIENHILTLVTGSVHEIKLNTIQQHLVLEYMTQQGRAGRNKIQSSLCPNFLLNLIGS